MNPDDGVQLLAALVSRGLLAPTTERIVALFAERWQCSHFDALLETSVVAEGELADALALLAKVPRLHGIVHQHVFPEVLNLIPFKLARELQAIPLADLDGKGTRIEVAIANPLDASKVTRLRQAIPCEIVLAVGERSDIVSAVDEMYPLKDRWPSLWDCVKSQ